MYKAILPPDGGIFAYVATFVARRKYLIGKRGKSVYARGLQVMEGKGREGKEKRRTSSNINKDVILLIL